MRSEPDTQLENPLKLLRLVEPPIAVAGRMSRKVIIYHMLATERTGEYMVGFPSIVGWAREKNSRRERT
jgi:hypothetical protein